MSKKIIKVIGRYSVKETVERLEEELRVRDIPLFAKFDHAENARSVDLKLRETTVVVFGSPQTGTGLMQENQEVAIELPLKIAIFEDEEGRTVLSYAKMTDLAQEYGLAENVVILKISILLKELVEKSR